jgi:hypothetical protein
VCSHGSFDAVQVLARPFNAICVFARPFDAVRVLARRRLYKAFAPPLQLAWGANGGVPFTPRPTAARLIVEFLATAQTHPAASVPTLPAASVPTRPAASVPTHPAASVPTRPAASVPMQQRTAPKEA